MLTNRLSVAELYAEERPTPQWTYAAHHRRGVVVAAAPILSGSKEGLVTPLARNLDARDLVAPFTHGALRGGTHVHQFSPDARLVSSTYEDHVLVRNGEAVQA